MSQLSFARRWTVVLGLATAILPQAASSEVAPLAVAVVAQGSLPGVKDADLNRFLAEAMNAGVNGPWHFEPALAGMAKVPNRIE